MGELHLHQSPKLVKLCIFPMYFQFLFFPLQFRLDQKHGEVKRKPSSFADLIPGHFDLTLDVVQFSLTSFDWSNFDEVSLVELRAIFEDCRWLKLLCHSCICHFFLILLLLLLLWLWVRALLNWLVVCFELFDSILQVLECPIVYVKPVLYLIETTTHGNLPFCDCMYVAKAAAS